MASRATTLRQKSSEKVAAAGRTHNKLIANEVGKRFGAAAGEAAAVLVAAVVDDLDAKAAEMVDCDEAHEAELRDDPEARELRDTIARNLGAKLVEVREQLTSAVGSAYVAKLGFSGKTPADPVELLRMGRTVADSIDQIPSPTPKIPGYQMNPALFSAPVRSLALEMEGLTAKVATEEREAEATLTAKYASIEAYDGAFSAAANLVSTLLEISGQRDLAKRVRPSSKRPGQTAEDAPADGSTLEHRASGQAGL